MELIMDYISNGEPTAYIVGLLQQPNAIHQTMLWEMLDPETETEHNTRQCTTAKLRFECVRYENMN